MKKEKGEGRKEKVRTSLLLPFSLLLFTFVAQADVLDKSYLSADRPAAGEAAISRSEALVFRSGGDRIYGQILRPNAAFGKGRPVVIFCHGFAGFTRMDDVAQALCRAGCVALVPHHRGAWGSEGKYTVANIIDDAVNLVDYVSSEEFTAKYGTDPRLVFLCGYSMGGNTALHAAILRPKVRGVILQAPCDIASCMRSVSKAEAFKFLLDNAIIDARTRPTLKVGGALAFRRRIRYNTHNSFLPKEERRGRTMGTGRTLRKESHVRPCKTPAGKARKNKAQRARLVKLGMKAEAVKAMGDDDVRILVQRPAVVKKLVAKKAK